MFPLFILRWSDLEPDYGGQGARSLCSLPRGLQKRRGCGCHQGQALEKGLLLFYVYFG